MKLYETIRAIFSQNTSQFLIPLRFFLFPILSHSITALGVGDNESIFVN